MMIAEFYNLLAQGFYDPSVLQQASPLGRVLAEVQSAGIFKPAEKKMLSRTLKLAADWVAAGNPLETFDGFNKGTTRRALDKIFAITGHSSLDQLFAAENDFQQQIAPISAAAKEAAAGNFRAQLSVRSQISNLLSNLPDVSAAGIQDLRGQEKSRLLRDLNLSVDEQRGDLIEVANAANFNPGRPLGDLEEFRARSTEDADLTALGRALALISGQQGAAAGNLNLLWGGNAELFNQAQAIAAADQGLRSPGMLETAAIAPNNAIANAVATSSNTAGNSLASFNANTQAQANFERQGKAEFGAGF
jgi:hypothetical protein